MYLSASNLAQVYAPFICIIYQLIMRQSSPQPLKVAYSYILYFILFEHCSFFFFLNRKHKGVLRIEQHINAACARNFYYYYISCVLKKIAVRWVLCIRCILYVTTLRENVNHQFKEHFDGLDRHLLLMYVYAEMLHLQTVHIIIHKQVYADKIKHYMK